jgi:LPXTG-motif cell wall-anchored protein
LQQLQTQRVLLTKVEKAELINSFSSAQSSKSSWLIGLLLGIVLIGLTGFLVVNRKKTKLAKHKNKKKLVNE